MIDIDKSRFRVKPGGKVRLSDSTPADTSLMPDRANADVKTQKDLLKLQDLQDRFYAEHQRALLIVLQGKDTSGKDGTIKHVMRGLNPQGCTVVSFKVPVGDELDHHFLWRAARAPSRHGDTIGIKSDHFVDVLSARVHD